jgi:hypothetical protein
MARPGKTFQFLLDRSNRFSPKPQELDPNPNTREAIAYFAPSLDFDIRLRQAKSKLYDSSFWEMCGNIHEHAMKAEVRRANRNFARPAIIAQIEFGEMLDSRFATSGDGRLFIPYAFLQERTPSVTLSDDPAGESDAPDPRRAPQ